MDIYKRFVLFWFRKYIDFLLYIIRKNKKNIPQRVAVYSHYFCVKLANLQTHHREVVIRISTSTMLLNLTLKFLNNLH